MRHGFLAGAAHGRRWPAASPACGAGVALAWALVVSAQASAAGLFLAPRGVVPLGRAGAQVAGAEDIHALTYNPAGLVHSPAQLLLDAALPLWRGRWTPGGGQAPVDADSLNLPSPTVGVVSPDWSWGRLALSWTGEYTSLQSWPSDPDSPARYAAGDFHGTTLSKLSLGAAWRPASWFDLGVAVHGLVGRFVAVNTISICDGAVCVQPMNIQYDARARMVSDPLWVPGVGIGAIVRPLPWLRVGLAWESGYALDSDVAIEAALPAAPLFASAVLEPATPRGRLYMQLPQQLRLGVQAELADEFRIELAGVWEPWHVHDRLHVALEDAQATNIIGGLKTIKVRDVDIARHFHDSYSVRLGGEWRLGGAGAATLAAGEHRPPLTTLRAGVMWEPSAIPDAYLSPMTVDLDKVIATMGVGVALGARWRLEAVYAHVFAFSRRVTDSEVLQINPVQPPGPAVAVGNGDYEGHGDIVGLGVSWQI